MRWLIHLICWMAGHELKSVKHESSHLGYFAFCLRCRRIIEGGQR